MIVDLIWIEVYVGVVWFVVCYVVVLVEICVVLEDDGEVMFDLMLYLVLMFIFVLGLDVLVFVVYVYFVCCDVWIEYCVEGIVFVIGLWDCVSVDVVICNV